MFNSIDSVGGLLYYLILPLSNSQDLRDHEVSFWTATGLLTIITSSFLCSQDPSLKVSALYHILGAFVHISAITFIQQGLLLQPVETSISYAALGLPIVLINVMWILSKLLKSILRLPTAFIAKRTIFWKLLHVCKGTYDTAVRKLHEQYGDIVQVGPYEYSISSSAYFERCVKFEKVRVTKQSDGNFS